MYVFSKIKPANCKVVFDDFETQFGAYQWQRQTLGRDYLGFFEFLLNFHRQSLEIFSVLLIWAATAKLCVNHNIPLNFCPKFCSLPPILEVSFFFILGQASKLALQSYPSILAR